MTGRSHLGVGERGMPALVNESRLRRSLARMLDEQEFLSPTASGRYRVPATRQAGPESSPS